MGLRIRDMLFMTGTQQKFPRGVTESDKFLGVFTRIIGWFWTRKAADFPFCPQAPVPSATTRTAQTESARFR